MYFSGGTSCKKKKTHCRVDIVSALRRRGVCVCGRGDIFLFFAVIRCMRSLRIVVVVIVVAAAAAVALSLCCYRPLNVVCLLSSGLLLLVRRSSSSLRHLTPIHSPSFILYPLPPPPGSPSRPISIRFAVAVGVIFFCLNRDGRRCGVESDDDNECKDTGRERGRREKSAKNCLKKMGKKFALKISSVRRRRRRLCA